MEGKVFNKLIDNYVSRMTPGASVYKQILLVEQVPDQVVKVSRRLEKRLELLIPIFDQMQSIDRINMEDKNA